jgi:flavoprotein
MLDTELWCKNCNTARSNHPTDKCLFQPTMFVALRCKGCGCKVTSPTANLAYMEQWYRRKDGDVYHALCYAVVGKASDYD